MPATMIAECTVCHETKPGATPEQPAGSPPQAFVCSDCHAQQQSGDAPRQG
jgi:Doubled CXXCH motif (Paired_CXXCH_1)